MSELLAKYREQHPQYKDIADDVLANALYEKYYKGKLDRDDFDEKVKPAKAPGFMSGVQENLSQGLAFGLVDEARAAGQATADSIINWTQGKDANFGENYGAALDRVRGEQSVFSRENPITATTAEITGGIFNPFTRLLAPGKSAGMGEKVIKGGISGSGMGALYGAGNSDGDLSDRAVSAGVGSVVGGTAGMAAPPVLGAIGAGGRFIANQTANRTASRAPTAATRKITETLQSDGLSATQAEARLAKMGPNASLMDVGPNTQSLARAVYTQPGAGKTRVGDFLRGRQEGVRNPATGRVEGGQYSRVSSDLDDMANSDTRGIRAATQAERKAQGVNYRAAEQAEDVVDVAPVIGNLDGEIAKSKGSIQAGLKKVRSYLVDPNGNPEITIDSLHQAKMAIDDLMSGEARSSMGNVAKARIREYQNQLVDAIESAGEAGAKYREGRLGTAAAWRIDDAVDAGEQFLLKKAGTADDITDQLAGMRPEEVEAFRSGVVQAMKSKIGDMNSRSDLTKKLMDIPNLERKVEAAFGDPSTFRKYISGLENEKAMFDAYSRIIGGSRTAEVAAEQADAGIDRGRVAQGVYEIFSPNSFMDLPRGVGNVVGGIKDRAIYPGPMRDEMARILTGRDLSAVRQQAPIMEMSDTKRKMIESLLRSSGALSGGNLAP